MEYRNLNNSDLKLSVITFGAWAAGGWMWGGTERSDAIRAIQASIDHGATSIDTAPVYGQGLSEEIVGEAISHIPRENVQILTKFGLRWNTSKGELAFDSTDNQGKSIKIHFYAAKESIIKECEDSLKRLRTDYIDLYQIHWPDNTTPIQETMEAVAQLQKEGKIRHAGVSNYSKAQMEEAHKYVHLVSNQVPYSMVLRDIEKELIPYCVKNKKSILAYSPLQRGLLTGKIKEGHVFANGDHRATSNFFAADIVKKVNAFLQNIQPLAAEKKATLSQLVLRWTIEQEGITIALVGARDAAQATQNAQTTHIKLSKEEIAFISAELNKADLHL